MALYGKPLTFDSDGLPRLWSIPADKAIGGAAVLLMLAGLFAVAWGYSVYTLIGMALDQRAAPLKETVGLLALAFLCPPVAAFGVEWCVASFASLKGRPSEVFLTENEFWHPQLAAPIRLADVARIEIRSYVRTPDLKVTLYTRSLVSVRFPSPFNWRCLLDRGYAAHSFSFLPMPWSNAGGLTQTLAGAVYRHGGEVVHI